MKDRKGPLSSRSDSIARPGSDRDHASTARSIANAACDVAYPAPLPQSRMSTPASFRLGHDLGQVGSVYGVNRAVRSKNGLGWFGYAPNHGS